MKPSEIFFSHASRDERFASEIVGMLRRYGLKVWFSKKHILGAQQWHDEIGKALKRCDWFVLLLSPDPSRSIWVQRELKYALRQKRFANNILPLLYKKCSSRDLDRLSWVLPDLQHIDFTKNYKSGMRKLLKVWSINYKPERD